MKCKFCGHFNSEESIFCENCILILNPPKILLPVVYFCIFISQGAAREMLPIGNFQQELKRLRAHLDNYKAKVKEIEISDETPEIVRDARKNLEEGYRLFEEGVNELEAYPADREKKHLIKGLEKLLESSNHLFIVDFEAELAHKTIPAPLSCIKCGYPNSPGNKFCEKCNASLPRLSAEDIPSSIAFKENSMLPEDIKNYQSANFLKVKEAAQAVLEKKISTEEFRETLKWINQIVTQAKEQFTHIKAPSSLEEPEVSQVLEWMQSGLDLYMDGIKEMGEFLKDGEAHHITLSLIHI